MITIQATPPAYSSVHGDLIYTVAEVVHTADPITYPNYKFIGDVYINSTLVARIKKVPDPVTKIGIFNVGQVVRNYIATTFNPTANSLVAQSLSLGQFNLSVTMKFGEEYAAEDEFLRDGAEDADGEDAHGVMQERVVMPDGEIPRAAPVQDGVGSEHPQCVQCEPAKAERQWRRVEAQHGARVCCAAADDGEDQADSEERSSDLRCGRIEQGVCIDHEGCSPTAFDSET